MIWQSLSFSAIDGSISNFNYWGSSTIPQVSVFTHPDFAWDTLVTSITAAIIASAIPAFIAWWSIRKNISTLREDREKQLQGLDKDRDAQLTISNNNIRAQIISANRQMWINELRSIASEYGAVVIKMGYLRRKIYNETVLNKNQNYITKLQEDNINEEFKLYILVNKIRLMINPKETETLLLYNSIKIINEILNDIVKTGNFNIVGFNEEVNLFLNTVQNILNSEWAKVKSEVTS